MKNKKRSAVDIYLAYGRMIKEILALPENKGVIRSILFTKKKALDRRTGAS